MNQDKTKQEILEIYKSLPKIIQDAITKSGWEKIIRDLVNKYNLRIDEGTQLENMTFAIMMGQMGAEEYYKSIREDFHLEESKAKELFEDVDNKVFGNIQDIIIQLEKMQKQKTYVPPTQNDSPKKDLQDAVDNDLEFPGSFKIEDTKETEEERMKRSYMRDDVDTASADDEILTVTRDEILKGIEDPENIPDETAELPDLKNSNIMPGENSSNNENKGILNSTFGQVDTSDEEPKVNNEIAQKIEEKKEEMKEAENNKPIDPVETGLNNQVSTSLKDYKSNDPYREPIE